MVKVKLDPGLLEQLTPADRVLEICDCTGHTVGYFHPASESLVEEKLSVRSPLSDEEIQRRRQQRTGRPLTEILERLERSCDTP